MRHLLGSVILLLTACGSELNPRREVDMGSHRSPVVLGHNCPSSCFSDDGLVSFAIEIGNPSREDWRVAVHELSCGCIAPQGGPTTVAAGDTLTVPLFFNPSKTEGAYTLSVDLGFHSLALPSRDFSNRVDVSVQVVDPVRIVPTVIEVLRPEPLQTVRTRISLVAAPRRTLRVSGVSDLPVGLRLERTRSTGVIDEYDLVVDPSCWEAGRSEVAVFSIASDGRESVKSIPIRLVGKATGWATRGELHRGYVRGAAALFEVEFYSRTPKVNDFSVDPAFSAVVTGGARLLVGSSSQSQSRSVQFEVLRTSSGMERRVGSVQLWCRGEIVHEASWSVLFSAEEVR